jgi:hypothetical protein
VNVLRMLAGWACIAIALASIAIALLGGFGDAGRAAASGSPVLMAHLPAVVFGLALLAVGTWLLNKKKKSP